MDVPKLIEKLDNAAQRAMPGLKEPKPVDEYRVILTAAERELIIYCLNYRYSPYRHDEPKLKE